MRTEKEIHQAHDLLIAFILGDMGPIDPDVQRRMMASADVLCWVLQHDHNKAFSGNLAELQKIAVPYGRDG